MTVLRRAKGSISGKISGPVLLRDRWFAGLPNAGRPVRMDAIQMDLRQMESNHGHQQNRRTEQF